MSDYSAIHALCTVLYVILLMLICMSDLTKELKRV